MFKICRKKQKEIFKKINFKTQKLGENRINKEKFRDDTSFTAGFIRVVLFIR